jgi:hypothetical protein
MKEPRLWHIVNDVNTKVLLISKVWRGYTIRRLLALAGPGVLNRSVCHNEEELVLMVDKSKVHPLRYFSFEEDGKIWWFDVLSMIGCFNAALKPLNPYTRQPISMETRLRLRSLYKYRIKNKLQTLHEKAGPRSVSDMANFQWTRVCQMLQENGFEDATPNMFSTLSPHLLHILLSYMCTDMLQLASEHPKTSKRYMYARALRHNKSHMYASRSPELYVATTLVMLLNDAVDTYPICFLIMSALFRL